MSLLLRVSLVLTICFFSIPEKSDAQTHGATQQNYGLIGPEDYHLPPPPSAEELLSRQIENKLHEILSLPKMLSKATALGDLRDKAHSQMEVRHWVGDQQSTEGWLLQEIDRLNQVGEFARAGDLYHLLAYEYFRLGAIEESHANLEMALSAKSGLRDQRDAMSIRHSLALLYEYGDDLNCSQANYLRVLDDARQRNNRELQARILTRLALLKAKQGQYFEAEQDIIRTVVPMFRQLRSTAGDRGRIQAYRTLADVYRLQNRHPEAQWFLLQAKEIVDDKNHNDFLPLILFDLAEVKKSSGNTQIAINEYIMADQLAGTHTDDLVLKLAIQEALGDIYHDSGRFKEALEALNRFDTLKAKLMSLDFPF